MNEVEHSEQLALCVTKEESSDESTIISSQTSTLTRNQGEIFRLMTYLISNSWRFLSISCDYFEDKNFITKKKFHKISGQEELQAVIASMQGQLVINSDSDEEDDEEAEEMNEECDKIDEIYDHGEFLEHSFKISASFNKGSSIIFP